MSLTLPQGSYRFRADLNGTQFWSGTDNHCAFPDCDSASVTIPGGYDVSQTMINYTYDPLYRLTAADYSTVDYYHYAYDSAGNRLTQDTSVSGLTNTNNYAYDNANRLSSVDGVDYTWDNNDNLLNDGANTYTYDSANRLTGVSNQFGASSYQYNGLGDRLSQTVNSVTSNYTLDLNPSTSLRAGAGLTQVLSDGTDTYTYGLGHIAQASGANTDYFLPDALGSVRQLADQTGAVTLSRTYDPYGVVTQSIGTSQSAYGFTGEMQDASGLTYLRARYYDSTTGRFITKDTWPGDYNGPLSLNQWNYVYSNPVNYLDPTGNIAEGDDAKYADLIVEYLKKYYNVQIKKDWGYRLIPVDSSTLPPGIITGILYAGCKWEEGNWRSLKELELTRDGVKAMADQLGSRGKFESAMHGQVTIHRVDSELFWGGGGYSINNVILPNNAFSSTDDWAKGTVVHELAHVWDFRELPPGRLSRDMVSLTKSFNSICDTVACHYFYNPAGGPPPSNYAIKYGPAEDWADSIRTLVYPSYGERRLGPIRRNYITNIISKLP